MRGPKGKLVLFFALLSLLPLVFFLSGRSVRAGGEDELPIPLIGLDRAGQEIAPSVPASAYTESLALAFTAIHKSALPNLARRREASPENRTWRLRTFAVGIGLTGTFGLGPIVSVSAAPRLRLVFTNSTNPIYPD